MRESTRLPSQVPSVRLPFLADGLFALGPSLLAAEKAVGRIIALKKPRGEAPEKDYSEYIKAATAIAGARATPPADWDSDRFFVEQRVQGVNPCALTRLSALPKDKAAAIRGLFSKGGARLPPGDDVFVIDYSVSLMRGEAQRPRSRLVLLGERERERVRRWYRVTHRTCVLPPPPAAAQALLRHARRPQQALHPCSHRGLRAHRGGRPHPLRDRP